MNARLLRVLAGLRDRPDDAQLSEHKLETTIRNRLYGERRASLDVMPVTTESQRRARLDDGSVVSRARGTRAATTDARAA